MVLAGGSGQLGEILARHFHAEGFDLVVLSRTPAVAPWRAMYWNAHSLGYGEREVDGADVVINLTGRSVDCRYSAANRREILESRIQSTGVLGEAIARAARPPAVWLNASTATIYRHTLDRAMDEMRGEIGGSEPDVPKEWRFSIDVATKWEEAFFTADTPQTRKVALRAAMVMSAANGGVFEVLSRVTRAGLGGAIGSGKQYVSWIHEADFVRAVEHAIAHEEISGVLNVCSPNPIPNAEFMSELRKAWGRSLGVPTREWMLRFGALILRTEPELVLKSRRVIPGRLLQSGFRFEYPEWPSAVRELVERRSRRPAYRRVLPVANEKQERRLHEQSV